MQLIQFHSKSALKPLNGLPADACRQLSNFSDNKVEFNGITYKSVEHAFQAQKWYYTDKPDMMNVFVNNNLTAAQAKSMGSKTAMKKAHTQLNIVEWEINKDRIMKELVLSKIQLNPSIQNILTIARENNINFVHFSRSDMYWGAHMNEDGTIKIGQNKLGQIYNNIINV